MSMSFSPTPPPFSPLMSSIEDADNVDADVSPPAPEHSVSGWFGFKIVGDNINNMVKPGHETVDQH